MCLKDRVLKNLEGNELRSKIADSLKDLHASLDVFVSVRSTDITNDNHNLSQTKENTHL